MHKHTKTQEMRGNGGTLHKGQGGGLLCHSSPKPITPRGQGGLKRLGREEGGNQKKWRRGGDGGWSEEEEKMVKSRVKVGLNRERKKFGSKGTGQRLGTKTDMVIHSSQLQKSDMFPNWFKRVTKSNRFIKNQTRIYPLESAKIGPT